MARKLRLEYPGAIYYLSSRGNRDEAIYRDDADRRQFLEILAEACRKTRWQVHAYCLITNCFHLVVETPEPNMVSGMKWLLGMYTKRFNSRHALVGHLFGSRYSSRLVEGRGQGYLRLICEYVHLSPLRATLLNSSRRLEEYPWSSYPHLLGNPESRPRWIRVDRLASEEGLDLATPIGREEFADRMERRRHGEGETTWRELPQGWLLGSTAFKLELARRMRTRLEIKHYGTEPPEVGEARANQIVEEELEARAWSERELKTRAKTDPTKVAIAQRLRQESVVPLHWIARRLQMGSVYTLRNALLANRSARSTARTPSRPARNKFDTRQPPSASPVESEAEPFNVRWD